MSTPTALARYNPADNAANRPALRTDPRYRAGVVMELLEIRRVLSAAVNAAVLDLSTTDESAITVDCPVGEPVPGDGSTDASADPATDGGGDFTIMDLTADTGGDTTDSGNSDNTADGFVWPEGWAWTLDRDPTQADLDALNAGDETNWVPVRTFGGVGDTGVDAGDGDTGENDGQDVGNVDDVPPAENVDGGDIVAIPGPDILTWEPGVFHLPGSFGVPPETLGSTIQNWPSGYAWTGDAAPTQADADAFAAGDTTGWYNLNDLGTVDGVNVDALLSQSYEQYPWGLDAGASYDDDGNFVQWPDGFAWNQDRAPTQGDADAFAAGDQTGWVKIADALGISDQVWNDYIAQSDASANWFYQDEFFGNDGGVWVQNWGGVLLDGVTTGVPVLASRGATEAPVPTTGGDTSQPSLDSGGDVGGGGAPQPFAPLAFGENQAGSILLGKLKKNVTDGDPSDLPFMN